MANDPNTYYAKPNEVVDGSKLPSNITNIQGAGGNIVTLVNNQSYIAGPGNNNITTTGGWSNYIFWYASGNVSINLKTGVVANNGFGGVDTISNLKNVMTGGGLSSSTLIGDEKDNQFWMLSDNNTVVGGGGSDTIIFYQADYANYSWTSNSDGSLSVKNKQSIKSNYLTDVSYAQFGNALLDLRNPNTIKSYISDQIKSYYFAGSTINIPITTSNVAIGTQIGLILNRKSPNYNNNNEFGSISVGTNGNAIITIPTSSTILSKESFQFRFNFDNANAWSQNQTINLIPSAKLFASNLQINSGSVETFTISTQLPAGEKFDYTLSGVTTSDVPSVPLTGTLTADANGSATLTVPIVASKSYQGDKKLTLTAGGSTSTVSVIDTAPKEPNTFYGTGGDDTIDGSKFPSNYTIRPGSGNDTVYLGKNQTYVSNYGNKKIIGLVGDGHYAFFDAIQTVNVNLLTGVVSNNGFGGQDTVSGINVIQTGSNGSTLVGNASDNFFVIGGGNNNITGNGGNDTATYWQTNSNQCVLSLRPDKGINVINNKTNTQDVLYGITTIQFDDKNISTSSITAAPVVTVFDTFDGTYLSIPQVVVGATSYINVVVTVKSVVTIGSGSPNNSFDVYNPSNNQLSIPSVKVGTAMYSNCVITVGSVISINGVLVNPTPTPSNPGSGSNTGGTPTPTGPVVTLTSTTPVNKTTNVQPTTDIVFKFSESIIPVSGNITLVDPSGKQDSFDVNVNPLIKISGNQLTFIRNNFYQDSGNYSIVIPTNVIHGVSGNNFPGVTLTVGIVGIATLNSSNDGGGDGGGGGGGGGG